MFDTDARRQSRDGHITKRLPETEQRVGSCHLRDRTCRDPHVRNIDPVQEDSAKSFFDDTGDREGIRVDGQGLSNHRRIAGEVRVPESIANDHGHRRARYVVVRLQGPSVNDLRTDNLKVVAGYDLGRSQDVIDRGLRDDRVTEVHGKVLKDCLISICGVVWVTDSAVIMFRRVAVIGIESDQLLKIPLMPVGAGIGLHR